MRVTIYDKNPGPGFRQWFLKTSWLVGCLFQKLFGAVDDYYGATSWDDAVIWLRNRPSKLTMIQYWGHGSPGAIWLGGRYGWFGVFGDATNNIDSNTVVWLRTCSTFQGPAGHEYSEKMSDLLGCTVAGHTRIIGPLQGGLHTRKPYSDPSWPVTEGELPKSWIPSFFRWGNNTVTCLATKIPSGW